LKKRSKISLVSAGAVALGFAAHAQAQAGADAPQDVADQRSQSFQAVQGAVREDVAGGPLLVAAYGVIWVIVLLYVIRLVRLQARAQADVERLERVLAPGSGSAPPLHGAAKDAAQASR
jgi:CcmD family protein